MNEASVSILETFHGILHAAVESGASDVHLKSSGAVKFRINGELTDVDCTPPTEEWLAGLAQAIAPPVALKRFAAEYETDFAYEAQGQWRFRVNIFTQRGRLVFAMRHVKAAVPDFTGLHLPDSVRLLAEKPHGLVLVAGATGSGKSTTLAAMIGHINANFKRHIITLEDPIEYVFEDGQSVVEQREIGIDTLSFDAGLKNVLRQDPDIIMLGELRDAESFAAAIRAVNTGHLVLTTLHSTRAVQTITRVLEFFPPAEHEQVRRQLAAGLLGIVCQELVKDVNGLLRPAVEVLLNNETVRGLIEGARMDALPTAIETGVEAGMQTFNHSLNRMLQEKVITQETALAHSPNPDALRMNLQGIFVSGENRRILPGKR
jgi:twitching motility protein PilT